MLAAFRKRRDERAFRELVRRYGPLVHGAAVRRLGSANLAEEAAQNAFLKLAEKVAAVSRHPERLAGWLHRTAWREAGNLARKEERHARRVRLAASGDEVSEAGRPEIFDRLDEALARLSGTDRELVLRRCCGGEDYGRLAGLTGLSPAACQKRVERALDRLAAKLGGGSGGTLSSALVAGSPGGFSPEWVERAVSTVGRRAAEGGSWWQSLTGVSSGSGTSVSAWAACVLLAGAGVYLGSRPGGSGEERAAAVATAPPPRVAAGSVADPAGERVLAPRLPVAPRPLGEVLETIQAGRFSPLVEFLPVATVDELRAIIAEDDIGMYGEVDAQDHYGTARNLALARWVEIDPQGAFRFAVENDRGMGDAPAVLDQWLAADPSAAVVAVKALPRVVQLELAAEVGDEAGLLLAAALPEIAWAVDEAVERRSRTHGWGGRMEIDEARQLADALAAAPDGGAKGDLYGAFRTLAEDDPEDARARLLALPPSEARAGLLLDFYRDHPPHSSALAPGRTRAGRLAAEIVGQAHSDPAGALRRIDSLRAPGERQQAFQALAGDLGRREPLRLLQLAAGLSKPVGWADLEPVLREAGRRDPRRALGMLPDVAAKVEAWGGVVQMTEWVLEGWRGEDPAAAIREAAELGIWLGASDIAKVGYDPGPLVELLEDGNESVRTMARTALGPHFRVAWTDGRGADFVARLPAGEADRLVVAEAVAMAQKQGFEEAMAVAALASPEVRRHQVLPEIARRTYRLSSFSDDERHPNDPDGTVAWARSLPSEDLEAMIAALERQLEDLPAHFSEETTKPMRKLLEGLRR